MQYATTCIDNFFDDPMSIVKLANKQKYEPNPQNLSPGMRSAPLHEINHSLFLHVCQKYLLNHHTKEEIPNISYVADARFQIVNTRYDKGFVHSDYPYLHTLIIYLSSLASPESGTSLYKLKDGTATIPHDYINKKREYYKRFISNKKLTPKENEYFKSSLERNNNLFQETVHFKNIFNRAIGFDSDLWHAAGSFNENVHQDRLTLIIFFKDILSSHTGLQRCLSFPHTVFD